MAAWQDFWRKDGHLAAEGWLVMFDLRATAPWGERLFVRDHTADGRVVHLVGC
jgi:CelD/BcsL family acetyltransferase involved in cellulose biosynthesis